MSQVTVICPGARRYNIKVTPNTVLLQVLEQACEKQKLDPALYALKHHNRLLDLSLPLRYSGVPNNGKLEVVSTDKPRQEGGEVVVAVQTADGTRVQSTLHSSSSLWDVLIRHKLDSSPDGMEPSLSYMRQEVCGERALQSKTLRAIGLSSGRGILRLSHRVSSEGVGDGSEVSVDVREQQRNKCLPANTSPQRGGRGGEKEGGEKVKGVVVDMEKKEGEEGEDEPRRKPDVVSMDTSEEVPYFPAHPFSYFSNEDEERGHGDLAGGPRGAEYLAPSLPPDQSSSSSSSAAVLMEQALTQNIHHLPPEVAAAQWEEVVASKFAQFSGLSRPHPLTTPTFPPQPKVYDEPCDRDPVVYHLDDPLPLTHTEEVSDTFFEHTVADLHVMHADLKKQAKTSNAPLMTSAMRAVRDEMKLDKYRKSIVRVYFPDRWVLQGCFRPRESLKMLVQFIRENLSDSQIKFHLYTTPPKKVLRSSKVTFAEAGFLPTAVVYVGVADDKPHPHLSESVLKSAVSSLEAAVVCRRHRPETTSPPATTGPSHQSQSHLSEGGGSTPTVPGQQTRRQAPPTTTGARKLPKWFKPHH